MDSDADSYVPVKRRRHEEESDDPSEESEKLSDEDEEDEEEEDDEEVHGRHGKRGKRHRDLSDVRVCNVVINIFCCLTNIFYLNFVNRIRLFCIKLIFYKVQILI